MATMQGNTGCAATSFVLGIGGCKTKAEIDVITLLAYKNKSRFSSKERREIIEAVFKRTGELAEELKAYAIDAETLLE